jgi:hypothetical protein
MTAVPQARGTARGQGRDRDGQERAPQGPCLAACLAAPLHADGRAASLQLYYHRLGTSQESDVLCYEAPDHPNWMCGASVSDDGDYVVLSVSESTDPVNRLYVARLENKGLGGACVRAVRGPEQSSVH